MINNRLLLKDLRKLQEIVQKFYRSRISEPPKDVFDYRCVHVSITCGCGAKITTPWNVSDTCKCSKCGKSIFIYQKEVDV